MIYETPAVDEPIRQGDIFARVPHVTYSLGRLLIVDEEEQSHETDWREVAADASVTALVGIKSVAGIVVTQNCDAVRGEYVCLCRIDPFLAATSTRDPPRSVSSWQKRIMRHVKTNHRLFYLPADLGVGFSEPMVADFRILLPVPRTELEEMRDGRVGRLNQVAAEHFRETLSHFFRRYAYNEWYPLTKEEFDVYAADCGERVEPFPWQR